MVNFESQGGNERQVEQQRLALYDLLKKAIGDGKRQGNLSEYVAAICKFEADLAAKSSAVATDEKSRRDIWSEVYDDTEVEVLEKYVDRLE